MEKEGNMITDWLDQYGNPEIEKQVEREAEEIEWQHFLDNEGYHDKESNDIWKIGCLDGAIWQKSRMYSEEEVLALLHKFNYDLVNSNIETFKDWFDENKK